MLWGGRLKINLLWGVGMSKLAIFVTGILLMGAIAFFAVNKSIGKRRTQNRGKNTEDGE